MQLPLPLWCDEREREVPELDWRSFRLLPPLFHVAKETYFVRSPIEISLVGARACGLTFSRKRIN